MRAHEFISEGTGVPPESHTHAHSGGYKFMDNGTDRTYNLNRIMAAAGQSDGKSTKAIKDFDDESFAGKHNMAYPYTEIEHNMLKQAFNTVSPSDVHRIPGDKSSAEHPSTHKVSPVAKRPTDHRKK
jgi:hypothetical protein